MTTKVIYTVKARTRNARRHIEERKAIEHQTAQELQFIIQEQARKWGASGRYIIEVFTGNWQPLYTYDKKEA